MKLSVVIFGLFFSISAFAVGPFGPDVSLKTVEGIDQQRCEAPKVAQQIYEKTGVNFIEGKASAIWDCKGVTPMKAQEKNCPYPQNVININATKCYSNTPDKSQIVCLSGPRTEIVEAVYADIGKRTEYQVRYDEIIVMSNTTSGQRRDTSTKMDATGCKVESVRGWDAIGQMNNGSYDLTFDKCSKMFDAILSGKEKMCDKDDPSLDRAGEAWTRIKKISFCFNDIPDFLNRYEAAKKNISKESPATKKADK